VTTPFWCLLVVALLPLVWSSFAIYYRRQQLGTVDNKYPRRQQAQLEGIGARAVGAHQNAWEALALFTPAVVVSHLANAPAGTAATLSLVFVAVRALHGCFYLANLDALRSLSFFVALGCVIGLFLISR
jgi:uncharacterized MAPEG superfamily protein